MNVKFLQTLLLASTALVPFSSTSAGAADGTDRPAVQPLVMAQAQPEADPADPRVRRPRAQEGAGEGAGEGGGRRPRAAQPDAAGSGATGDDQPTGRPRRGQQTPATETAPPASGGPAAVPRASEPSDAPTSPGRRPPAATPATPATPPATTAPDAPAQRPAGAPGREPPGQRPRATEPTDAPTAPGQRTPSGATPATPAEPPATRPLPGAPATPPAATPSAPVAPPAAAPATPATPAPRSGVTAPPAATQPSPATPPAATPATPAAPAARPGVTAPPATTAPGASQPATDQPRRGERRQNQDQAPAATPAAPATTPPAAPPATVPPAAQPRTPAAPVPPTLPAPPAAPPTTAPVPRTQPAPAAPATPPATVPAPRTQPATPTAPATPVAPPAAAPRVDQPTQVPGALPAPRTAPAPDRLAPGIAPERLGPGIGRGQDVRIEELRTLRRERVEEGGRRVIIEEPGNRVIIRENGREIIRHDETERFRRAYDDSEVRVERRGEDQVTIVRRPNGVEVITVRDVEGNLVRRVRRDPRGTETVLIQNEIVGQPRSRTVIQEVIDLPPPRVTIPREKYVVEVERASQEDIYEAFTAPPVERVERRYTLDEVRQSQGVRERVRRVDVDTVTFEFGSWQLSEGQIGALTGVAEAIRRALAANPSTVFLIEGHTDAVGSDTDNLTLSDRRAETVAAILTERFQIPAENLTTQGYGEQYLKVNTQEAAQENRRVTVRNITPLLNQQAAR